MKIYVDEIPKKCADCPCMNNDGYGGYDCNLYYEQNEKILGCDYYSEEKPKECPLQSLAEHDKQVRKQVVEEIRFLIDETTHLSGQAILYGKIMEILDQVEKENSDVKYIDRYEIVSEIDNQITELRGGENE